MLVSFSPILRSTDLNGLVPLPSFVPPILQPITRREKRSRTTARYPLKFLPETLYFMLKSIVLLTLWFGLLVVLNLGGNTIGRNNTEPCRNLRDEISLLCDLFYGSILNSSVNVLTDINTPSLGLQYEAKKCLRNQSLFNIVIFLRCS